MAFGLLTTGFAPKTLTDLKAELEAAFRAAFGASIDVSSTSNFGQLIGILADRYAELWDVAQAVYKAMDPDAAEGASLTAIGAITGTIPRPATRSTVTVVATGTNGTVLPIGRVVSVETIGTRFELVAATLATTTAWIASTVYAVGNIRANGGNIYYCADAGTSAASGGPTTTGLNIIDGGVLWHFMGAGTAHASVAASSQDTGPKIAATGSLNVIETSVSGWTGVNNFADAILGEDIETPAAFRIRREEELLGASRSTIDSIRTRVSEDVDGAFGVIVFQNDTEVTNADGLPPHSVEVLVRGGLDQDIAECVFANVAAGITMYGNQSTLVTDEDNGGQTYAIHWSRPTEIDVWVIANVQVDALTFPLDGATQIADALLAHGVAYRTGRDVHSSALKAACFDVEGVVNAATVFIGLAVTPTLETSLTMTLRQLPIFDSARITVNITPVTP